MRRRSRKPRVFVFIDSQNLNMGVQKFGWKMNWVKFREFLTEKYGASKAFMFIGYVPEFEDLYMQMHDAGFLVVLKPTFDMTRPRPEEDETKPQKEEDKKPVKGNTDADMVLWAMKEMKNYDKAVIVSGDGDFYSLVEYLDEENKLLKLLVPNNHFSGLFNKYEKYVENLTDYRNQLAYHDRRKQHNNHK